MTREEIVQKLSVRQQAIASGALVPPPYVGSDFALNDLDTPPTELRAAAVLVPLVDRVGVLSVLLTQRTEDMPSHAGQIAFPGGRKQAEDESLIVTALRETEEEVGIARRFIEVVGAVDLYRTGRNGSCCSYGNNAAIFNDHRCILQAVIRIFYNSRIGKSIVPVAGICCTIFGEGRLSESRYAEYDAYQGQP